MTADDLTRLRVHPDFMTGYERERGPRTPSTEQFIDRFNSRTRAEGDCLVWTASSTTHGYGVTYAVGKTWMAHRVAYWMHTGTPPPPRESGLEIDHLCRNRACVNPDHLELVTHAVNNARSDNVTARQARQTHCKRGHEFTEENTRITAHGHRDCRTCARERWHTRKDRA